MKTIQFTAIVSFLAVGAIAWSLLLKHGGEHLHTVGMDGAHRDGDVPLRLAETASTSGNSAESNVERTVPWSTAEIPFASESSRIAQPSEPKRPDKEHKEIARPTITSSAPSSQQTMGMRPSKKDPPRDPVAREALYFVGADPAAEEYWLEAINDPSLSEQERQDLIEDLNEDGLSDPHHPTIDDLPLIVSRIDLLEEVGQDAMDQVNADAFQEAYKDLLNLARAAAGGAAP